MHVEHLPADTSAADIHEILKRDGCVVIDNILSSDCVDSILAEMATYTAATPLGSDEFDGFQTRRTGSLVARSPSSHDVIMHPTILGVADLALAHATNYQLHCTQLIEVGPNSAPQLIHRDQWAFDLFQFPAGFDSTFSTMWAMTDFTPENGATRVIPGSHEHEDALQYAIEDTIPAVMDKGSVLLYTGSLYHGAGENSPASLVIHVGENAQHIGHEKVIRHVPTEVICTE